MEFSGRIMASLQYSRTLNFGKQLVILVYDIIEFAGRILNVPQCYIRATNFHKDNLWVLLLLRSKNLSYWNLNLFLDYFVIFDSGLGHSAILKQTLILGIRN